MGYIRQKRKIENIVDKLDINKMNTKTDKREHWKYPGCTVLDIQTQVVHVKPLVGRGDMGRLMNKIIKVTWNYWESGRSG